MQHVDSNKKKEENRYFFVKGCIVALARGEMLAINFKMIEVVVGRGFSPPPLYHFLARELNTAGLDHSTQIDRHFSVPSPGSDRVDY